MKGTPRCSFQNQFKFLSIFSGTQPNKRRVLEVRPHKGLTSCLVAYARLKYKSQSSVQHSPNSLTQSHTSSPIVASSQLMPTTLPPVILYRFGCICLTISSFLSMDSILDSNLFFISAKTSPSFRFSVWLPKGPYRLLFQTYCIRK